MKLKKFLSAILCVIMIFSMASCSKHTDKTAAEKAEKMGSTLLVYIKGTAEEDGAIEFSDCRVYVKKGDSNEKVLKKLSQVLDKSKIWNIEDSDEISFSLREKEVEKSTEPEKAKEIKGLKIDYIYSKGECCLAFNETDNFNISLFYIFS